MGRRYRSKPGVRRRNYKYPQIEDAINALESGEMNIKEAAAHYKIPKSTLHDRYKGKYKGTKPGRKTALSDDTEKEIVKFLTTTANWGFPQAPQDLIKFVKYFLTTKDIYVPQFCDGITPGYDWVKNFLDRHKDNLTERYAILTIRS